MKYIEKQQGERFFEDIREVLNNKRLTDKERIPRYRTILEDVYKELTKESSTYLGNLFARMVFVFNEYAISGSIRFKSHGVRISANKVVHDSKFRPSPMDGLKCLYQLSEVIGYFAQIEVPIDIMDIFKANIPTFEKAETNFQSRPPLPTNDFYAVVEDVYVPENSNQEYCVLTCHTDEWGRIKVRLSNKKDKNGFGSDPTYISEIISPYQNTYLTKVSQHPEKKNEFFTTKESLVVLEPDYLVGATDLSGCRQKDGDNHLIYILKRFQEDSVSDRMMIGNVVGKMLDDIATNPDYVYQNSFEFVMRTSALGMLCLANRNGKYDNSTIQEIYIEAKDHEDTLKRSIENYKGKQLVIEPTFISSKFGLNGRLDLMLEGQSNRKDIIELKSSRGVPALEKRFWPNHEAQAMCYDLLLSSTFPDRIGHSSILYSSASMGDSPERNVNGSHYLTKQEILQLRNEVVSTELKLAKGIFDVIDEMESGNFGSCPPYLKSLKESFALTMKNLDPLLKCYFLSYLKFIYRELQVAKVGMVKEYDSSNGFAGLWKLSKIDKIKNYNVLVNMEIQEVTQDFDITMEVKTDLFSPEVTTFRKGEIAILYPTPDPDFLDPLASQILKCVITSIEENIVKIKLRNLQLDKDYFKNNKSDFWALEKDFTEQGYHKMLELNYQFLKSDKKLIDLVLGKKRPTFKSVDTLTDLSEELNPVQQKMVSKALAAEDYFLIQGPPGTGKTSKVLSQIVKQTADSDKNVMVIAFTNRAVTEITINLRKLNIDCIQLGKGEEDYHWSQLSKTYNLKELYHKVAKTKVFVATQASFSANLNILELKEFDMLVVDEASQLLEPQLTGLLKHFKRWVLIGDENQLSAVVIQSENDSACFENELNAIGIHNLRESLFSRLKKNAEDKKWNDCYGMLTIHYRMHEDIAAFPNQFYDGKLKSGSDIQKAPIAGIKEVAGTEIHNAFSKSRIVFIPTKQGAKSKINNEEADLIKDLVRYIHLNSGPDFDPNKTVGIITPFRAQVATIKEKLGADYKDVTVDTVERFQGSERDIIIISYAIKNAAQLKSIQSINEAGVDRKLNVAITRAKNHLIILGTKDILEKNEIFKNLIFSIRSKGGYMMAPNKAASIPTDLF